MRCSDTGRRHQASRRAARRPAVGPRDGRRIPLRERARRIHPQGDRRSLPYRGRRLSRSPSAGGRRARRICAQFKTQGRRRRGFARSRSIFTTPMRTTVSSTTARAAGIDMPIVPGIMPIGELLAAARFSDAAAPRFRAGCASNSKATATTTRRSARSAADVVTALCDACWPAARRACISTRSTAPRRRSPSSNACAEAGGVQLATVTLRRCRVVLSFFSRSPSRCRAWRTPKARPCTAASASTVKFLFPDCRAPPRARRLLPLRRRFRRRKPVTHQRCTPVPLRKTRCAR